MSFEELGLAPELLRALADEGYTSPTPIQKAAIPRVLEGGDLLAAAQTGTGKTAAFTLPILQRLSQTPTVAGAAPRALVLVPTRELAAQVGEAVRSYGRNLNLRCAIIFGGVGANPQIDALRRGVDVIVATPGRLLDHVQQRNVNLSAIEVLVLDEADRMLDMGFIRDIRRVITVLPKNRQNLLFSATFNPEIRALAETLLHKPSTVDVAPRNQPIELVEQRAHPVDKANKTALIAHLVTTGDWRQVLVFTRTKHGANRLAEQLAKTGIETAAIHGNKSQNARTKSLADFKSGKVRVLVATDIAARGIDIDQLPHVINHELPNVPEDYVHRIGRTGRAGMSGEAISLIATDDRDNLRGIERLLKRSIPSSVVAGFEPGTKHASATTDEDRERPARPQRPPSSGRGRPSNAPPRGDRNSHAPRSSAPARPAAPRGDRDGNRAQPDGGDSKYNGGVSLTMHTLGARAQPRPMRTGDAQPGQNRNDGRGDFNRPRRPGPGGNSAGGNTGGQNRGNQTSGRRP